MSPGGESRGLAKSVVLFAIAYAIFILVMAMLAQVGLPDPVAAVLFAAMTLLAFAVVGLVGRTMQLDEFEMASRAVAPGLNGMATAAAFIGSAGFLGLAGTFTDGSSAGVAAITGWALGFLLLSVAIAPYFRNSGALTAADFLARRYRSDAVRLATVAVVVIVSLVFLIAEIAAAALVMQHFLGLSIEAGVPIAVGIILVATLLGGMQSLTLASIAQYVVMAISFITPVAVVSFQNYDIPFPQLTHGYAMAELAAIEAEPAAWSFGRLFPVGALDGFNMVLLTLSIAVGIASFPHLLMRSATTASVGGARRAAGWALLFALAIAATAPAYAPLARLAMSDVAGWAPANVDFLVLDFPEVTGLSAAMTALIAVGALAAIFASAAAVLFSIAATLGHDIFSTFLDRNGTAGRKLIVIRIFLVATATLAALEAMKMRAGVFEVAATSLSLAASGLFPALLLGIWWRRATAWGALAGIAVGFAAAAAYVGFTVWGGLSLWQPLGTGGTGLPPMAAAFFGVPLGLLTIVFVSQLTGERNAERNDLVDAIRHPVGPWTDSVRA